MRTGVVPRFDGEFFFLSNFYMAPFRWRDAEFQSGEHAFQAAKAFHMIDTTGRRTYRDKILACDTPAKAKYAGRSVEINLDSWNAQRVVYMREMVHAKFRHVSNLAGQLINTGAMLLVEGNDWGDDFWGRCKKDGKMVGLNTLGAILMEERGYWLHSNFDDIKGETK